MAHCYLYAATQFKLLISSLVFSIVNAGHIENYDTPAAD